MKNDVKAQGRQALKWIYAAVRRQAPSLIVIMALTCVLSCTGSVIALILGRLVDAAVGGTLGRLIMFAVLLGCTYLINIAGSAVIKYMSQRCKAAIEVGMRGKYFSLVLQKDYAKVSEYHSGELMNRMTSDVSVISEAVTSILPNFAGFLTKFIFALVMILTIQPLIGIIYSVGGVLVLFAARLFRTKTKSLHKLSQKAEDNNRSFWQETMNNLLAVKVFTAEKSMNGKSDELQQKSFRAKMNSVRFSVLANTGYSFFMCAGYVFAFIWCAVCLLLKVMTYGTMISIIQLVGQIQSPFSAMSGIFTQYYTAIASAERLMDIENLQNEPTVRYIDADDTYKRLCSIDFSSVCFAYDVDDVLHGFDFSVKRGEFVGIIGNSGIGKSTLFRLLLGVYAPTSGKITLNLGDDEIPCDTSARRLFAYVPQGNMLFSGSLRENITLMNPSASDELVNAAVKICCADEFVSALPSGLDSEIGEKGLGLSEGQIQRIAIARALVANSPVLLLDEATSALDSETETRLLDNLRKIKNITCIIVTHRDTALSICDRTMKLEGGKIFEV